MRRPRALVVDADVGGDRADEGDELTRLGRADTAEPLREPPGRVQSPIINA